MTNFDKFKTYCRKFCVQTRLAVRICLSITAITTFATQAAAQNNPQEIRLDFNDAALSQVLKSIETQSRYTFFYNNDIDVTQSVSAHIASSDINSVVTAVLKGTDIAHRITDNRVVLFVGGGDAADDQERSISGKVTDAAGLPLVGVTVLVTGTNFAAVTDVNGGYTVRVPGSGAEIVYSYIGYQSQQRIVGSQTVINLALQESTAEIGAVVVTALGIKRDQKSLTYNVQQIAGDDISIVKDVSVVNSLVGKVAGVRINQSSSGTGGSTRVVMRGAKSLFGDNNVLYVLNGIPMMSLRSTQSDNYYEGAGVGDSDGISSINPDDIESLSVLTGASAAALYGNRGANGVILITTKKGSADHSTHVSYSNNTTFSNPFVTHQFQNTYGRQSGDFKSWGEKLGKPSSYDPNDFFQTGYNTQNTVSVASSSERSQSFVSAGSVNSRGIIPNNEYSRYNFTIRHGRELVKDKLELDTDFFFTKSESQNGVAQGLYYNPLLPVYLFPPSENFERLKTYEIYDSGRNFATMYWPYSNTGLDALSQNPYWITNRNMFNTTQNRYIVSGSLKWKITDWINLSGRIRMDHADTDYERKLYASTPGLFCQSKGHYREQKMTNNALYADVLLNIDKQLSDDFRLTANIGASLYDEKYDMMGQSGNLLRLANFFHVSNINMSDPTTEMTREHIRQQTQAVYGSVQVGFRNFVYVDASVRSDWFSTLAGTPSMSSVYPSVGASLILSELIPQNKILNYWKIRGSYAGVGNPPSPYLTYTYIPLEDQNISNDGFAAASHLKPELTKSFEIGTELRMFNNKLSLEFTYYNTNTHNQLFKYEIPSSSGYSYAYANAGKVNNRGIELKAGFNQNIGPVKWETTLTYTRNRNEIKELLDEYVTDPVTGTTVKAPQEFIVSTAESYRMVLTKGGTMGDIYATHLKQDPNGYIYVNPMTNGIEIEPNSYVKVGSIDPKYTLGWHNSFSWKGLNLGFLIDARVGGVVVSGTEAMMDQYGVSKSTARDRDNGGAIVNGGRMDAKTFYSVAASGTTGVLSNYVYSATNVRLRELSLSYTLPALARERLRITLSLIANNVLMLHNEAPFDPELTSNTGTYYQGFDYFMPPSLRSWGFGVKVNF